MKKIAALAVAVILIAAAAIGSTVAYATEATVETEIYTTGQVDIAFENTGLADGFQVLPGTVVDKTVKIKNMEASQTAWVWFSVTVPASNGIPLVQPTGAKEGWVDLGSVSGSEQTTYYFGHETALDANTTTTAGMTELVISGQIDRVDGQYCVVTDGKIIPVCAIADRFSVLFDAYAIEASAELTSVGEAFSIWKNNK